MGNSCISCDAVTVTATATAKVIFPDGRLQEYAGDHISVSQVLSSSKDVLTSPCFLCNADDMELDGYVSAVPGNARLRTGRMYFVLPTSLLRRRLRPEEMASLAVRASTALVTRGMSVVQAEESTAEAEEKSAPEKRWRSSSSSRRRAMSGSRGRDFTSELGTIEE